MDVRDPVCSRNIYRDLYREHLTENLNEFEEIDSTHEGKLNINFSRNSCECPFLFFYAEFVPKIVSILSFINHDTSNAFRINKNESCN